MLRFLAVPLCALALSGSTVEDGQLWLKQAEEQLYRWPQPPALVRFEVHTDVLAPTIAAMKRDLEQKLDAEASRLVAALEKLTLRGAIDTGTGKLESEVEIDYSSSDLRTQKAVDMLKQRVRATLAGCFASLPLHDPRLLRRGAGISAAEERADERVVTADGGHGDKTVLHLARDTGLPRRIELPQLAIGLEYQEATHGRFVPLRLETQPRGAAASRAEFRWQHEGELWFPEHVRLCSKGAEALLDFDHLVVEPRAR
jgi:hypothetical protein